MKIVFGWLGDSIFENEEEIKAVIILLFNNGLKAVAEAQTEIS